LIFLYNQTEQDNHYLKKRITENVACIMSITEAKSEMTAK